MYNLRGYQIYESVVTAFCRHHTLMSLIPVEPTERHETIASSPVRDLNRRLALFKGTASNLSARGLIFNITTNNCLRNVQMSPARKHGV